MVAPVQIVAGDVLSIRSFSEDTITIQVAGVYRRLGEDAWGLDIYAIAIVARCVQRAGTGRTCGRGGGPAGLLIESERVQELDIALLAQLIFHAIEGVIAIGPAAIAGCGLPGGIATGLATQRACATRSRCCVRGIDRSECEGIGLRSTATCCERTLRHVHHFNGDTLISIRSM